MIYFLYVSVLIVEVPTYTYLDTPKFIHYSTHVAINIIYHYYYFFWFKYYLPFI